MRSSVSSISKPLLEIFVFSTQLNDLNIHSKNTVGNMGEHPEKGAENRAAKITSRTRPSPRAWMVKVENITDLYTSTAYIKNRGILHGNHVWFRNTVM